MEGEIRSKGYKFQVRKMSRLTREREEYEVEGYLGSIDAILRPKANTIQCYDLIMQESGYKNICYIIFYTFLSAQNIPLKLQSIP